eukprot:6184688-Amphidinium_carterae.1
MIDGGLLRHLPWERILSLRFEVEHGKATRMPRLDPQSGSLYLGSTFEAPDMPIASELQLHEMLVRRGIAMEMPSITTVEFHLRLSDFYLRRLRDPPADPSRFMPVSMHQILK